MARSVIAYDKDLPEISRRLPWSKPDADLVKDPNAETGWLEYFVKGLTTRPYEVRAQDEQTIIPGCSRRTEQPVPNDSTWRGFPR
jgi:hypothetical protein